VEHVTYIYIYIYIYIYTRWRGEVHTELWWETPVGKRTLGRSKRILEHNMKTDVKIRLGGCGLD
jgi:hypothetical protein